MIGIRQLSIALATVILSWTATDARAEEVYRWVDDEGITHYSSTPPPDRGADRIETANPPADDPEARRKEIEKLEQSNKTRLYRKRLERRIAAEDKQQQQERERFCSRLRDKRQTLLTIPQVREESEDGVRVMAQEERDALLQQYEQRLAEHCGGV